MKRNINTFFLASFMAIVASLFVCYFCPESVSAHTATLTTSNSVSLDVLASHDGVAIDEESIEVETTCRAGYNLSIATSTSSSLYLNGDGTGTATFTAVDGTSTLANSTNKWGYTLTSNASSSTIFSPLSTTAATLKTPSQTASQTDIDDTFSIFYGTKADSSVTPGSYQMANSGAIVYYLTMDATCATVDIAYDGNNADAGTMGAAGTGVIHTGVRDGDTVSLIASNFSRTGYGFAGWSFDSNAGAKLVDNDTTNNPVVYGPQEDATMPSNLLSYDTDEDGIVKLYAVWIQSQGNLQGWMGCSNLDTATYDSNTGALDLTKNSITALTDQRDNDTYAVARLADGNCWMIENLRLDADATRGNNQTDPTVTNEWLSQGYGKSATYGNFSGLATAESAGFSNTYTANSLYYSGVQEGTASIDIGTDTPGPAVRMPRYNNLNTASRSSNPTSNTFPNDNTTGGIYSYGNYYTWPAAIANTAYLASTTETSLCPDGWRLPEGGTKSNEINSDFWSLIVIGINNGVNPANYESINDPYYTGSSEGRNMSKAVRAYPNNFLYSGFFDSSSAIVRGSSGLYWSSTQNLTAHGYSLSLKSSSVYPGGISGYKYNGFTVRCVASDPINHTLSYDANGGSGAPSSQTTTANGSATHTVSSTTPTRSGYTFAGWIDEKGNEVQAGGTFRTKDTNVVLYARWTNNSCNPSATTIGTGNSSTDAVCLQDVTPSMKSSLSTADSSSGTYTLIDARDGQSYTIAKLVDGNLWLTKNLNYGSNNDTLLTSYDTDLPSGATFMAPASTTNFETTNSSATYISPKILTDSSYGGYYSFAAAIASTDTYSASNQNITTSICPKGWDLPTSAIYNNLRTVSGNTTFAKMSAAPYSFIYAGYRNGASFASQTTAIRLWTSTNYSASYAYYTTAYGTAAYSSNYKRYGESVRCIASNGMATINYDGNGTIEYPTTGTTASQTNVEINSAKTMANGYTRDNWTFNGWNTAADGSGTSISANTAISSLNLTSGSTITLYAQWNPQYTITYVNNCMSWASGDGNCTATSTTNTSTQKINLNSSGNGSGTLGAYNTFTMTGWKIKEWTTNADGSGTAYPVSSTYSVTGAGAGDSITLYAHWVPTYTVQYDGNGSDNDSTGMGSTNASTGLKGVRHTDVAEGDTFDLFAPNFKKTGYGFVGWSIDANAWSKLTDNDTSNDTKIWGPNEVLTAPTKSSDILTLYAVWAPAETSGGNPVYFQGWTGCDAMTATTYNSSTGTLTVANNSVTALTDERDGNVYAIAKLADESCWMIENLRLADIHDENGNTIATTLTTSNTNIDANSSTLPITNIYSSSTTSNSLSPSSSVGYNASSAPYGWCNTDTISCDDQSRLNTTNSTWNNNTASAVTPSQTQSITSANAHTNFNNYVYSYGNYYNWYSATAGYGTYSRTTSEHTTGDLCPAGWKLPSGGGYNTKGSFLYLANQMSANSDSQVSSNKFRMFPNNYIYSGYWVVGSRNNGGREGVYWSASAYNNNYAYRLFLTNTNIGPGNVSVSKYNGFSVRCITDNNYTIVFDGNGGTGTMSNQSIEPNQATNLSANAFTRSGYAFTGWNTSADGSGTPYANGQSVTNIASPRSKITLYAQWTDCTGNNICYETGASSGVEGTMGKQTITSSDTSATLLASNYSRSGYGFAGWSDVPDYTTNQNAHFYGPQDDITFTAGAYSSIGLRLYAVWVASAGSLQDSTKVAQLCGTGTGSLTTAPTNGTANLSSVSALTDQRDNQTYAIAKLADGKCWMIENLRLEAANTTGNTNKALAQGYGTSTTYGNFGGLATAESTGFTSTYSANSLYSSDGSNNTINIGTSDYPEYRMPRYNNTNTQSRASNPTSNSFSEDGTIGGMYSYGNYYTWQAAIADLAYNGTTNNSATGTSLCPAGWHLPTGGFAYAAGDTSGVNVTGDTSTFREFYNLGYIVMDEVKTAYEDTPDGAGRSKYTSSTTNIAGDTAFKAFRKFPNNFLRSGYFNGSRVMFRGGDGDYWTSTAGDSYGAFKFYLGYGEVNPGTGLSNKFNGFSVRCVAGS